MRKIVLVLLLVLVTTTAQANCVKAQAGGDWVDCETGQPAPAPAPMSGAASYKRVPASFQARLCQDPEQQAGCKLYFAGFADIVAMLYGMSESPTGICGSTADLAHEFIHDVNTNPKARDAETHAVLLAVLAKNHSCGKAKGKVHAGISAGYLMDTCKAGGIGFNLCSQYENGFLGGLLFLAELTEVPIVCGNPGLLNSVSLTGLLNDSLQSNFKLRRDPAVGVMLSALMARMPCPK